MSSIWVALALGAAVGGYAWSWFARSTGNARPSNTAIAAGAVGFVAFLVLVSVFKLVLHI